MTMGRDLKKVPQHLNAISVIDPVTYIKAHCPTNESWPEKKSHEERRSKKAYIAWDDNDSSDGSEKEINLLSKDYEIDENISQED